jgi:hypothetical protein
MENAKVVICALARNCASAVKKNRKRIEKLRKSFLSCDVLVIENDSKDDTKKVLLNWAEKSAGVYVITNDFGTQTIPSQTANLVIPEFSYHRVEKMAQYRNMYLDWIEKQKKDYHYVIVLDIDIQWFNYRNIVNIIKNAPDEWGAICANGRNFYGLRYRYYDTYAFSESKMGKMDTHTLRGYGYRQEALRIRKLIQQKTYTSVYSAFGGLAIYKYPTIKGLRYQAILNPDENVEALCEHVSLNDAIINKGYKVYIARDLDLISDYSFNFKYEIKIALFKNRYIRSFLLKYNLAGNLK